MRSRAICLVVPFAVAACATSANDELRRDVDNLRAELHQAREKQDRTQKRVAELEERLDAQDAAPAAPAAAKPAPRKLPIVKLLPPGPPAPPPLATKVSFTEPTADALEKILAAEDGPQKGDEEFKIALGTWRAGDRARAAQEFEEFATRFPRHGQADNALLVAGSLFFQMDLPTRALEPLDTLGKEYPAGDALPDGLLLSSRCREKLEQKDLARAALDRLMDDFPDSTAAKQARAELDRLPK